MVPKRVSTISLVALLIVVLLTAATSVSFGQAYAPGRPADASDVFLPLVVYQPPPPVRVLPNHSHFVSSTGTPEIFGEVQNDSPDWVFAVKVPVSLLNDVGQVLATDEVYAELLYLAPGQRTCFGKVFYSPPAGWNSYRLDAPTYEIPSSDVEKPKLTIYGDQGNYDPALDIYTIEGKVRNDSSRKAQYVKVIATVYDASGTVFDCDRDDLWPANLGPGRNSDFQFNLGYLRDYADVASYRLQADGEFPWAPTGR
jgi:hypothetical protein